jgi:GTP-binding protein
MTDFLDQAEIYAAGGGGGDGFVHFRREKYVPMGGPDGGDGGHGGNVMLRADTGLNTLYKFRFQRRFVAPAGMPGSRSRRHGKKADDVVVTVPVGTTVLDSASAEVLADLAHEGDEYVVARGGKGGLGNMHFATSTRQAPAFAEKGEPGRERTVRLELKLVADVGFVGLPNAGKSTLLASISAARPKIADYPFTTLTPNLGVVAIDDFSFVAADIPGLIEGAHDGVGLGDEFLRHIERSGILLRVVDGSSHDPLADLDQVAAELKAYDPQLLERPQLVAITKMDLPDARGRRETTLEEMRTRGFEGFPISAVTHEGIDRLLSGVRVRLEEQQPARQTGGASAEEIEEYVFRERTEPEDFTVVRKRATFYVQGDDVERVVNMTDFDSTEALEHLQRRLRRMGVFTALEREGVRAGSRVMIGELEMTWEGEIERSLDVRPSAQKGSGSRRRTAKETHAYRGRRHS